MAPAGSLTRDCCGNSGIEAPWCRAWLVDKQTPGWRGQQGLLSRWVEKACRKVCVEDALVDLGPWVPGMTGSSELACVSACSGFAPWKNSQALPSFCSPQARSSSEQMRRQHHVTVLCDLCLFDEENHAFASMCRPSQVTSAGAQTPRQREVPLSAAYLARRGAAAAPPHPAEHDRPASGARG